MKGKTIKIKVEIEINEDWMDYYPDKKSVISQILRTGIPSNQRKFKILEK